jgi:hypothetical protein
VMLRINMLIGKMRTQDVPRRDSISVVVAAFISLPPVTRRGGMRKSLSQNNSGMQEASCRGRAYREQLNLRVEFPGATHPDIGFQHQHEAEKFRKELGEQPGQYGLELNEDKTRLIRFGRFARQNRDERGEGKPESFTFVGFQHICAENSLGRLESGALPAATDEGRNCGN